MRIISLRDSRSGFAHIGLIVVLVLVLGIVGGGGYYIWHKNQEKKNADSSSQSAKQTAKITNYDECAKSEDAKILTTYPAQCITKDDQHFTDQSHVVKIADSKVTFTLPEEFKLLKGGDSDMSSVERSCFKSVSSDQVECIDNTVLVLKNETYTNSDQFSVSVSVYRKDKQLSVRNWFYENGSNELGLGYGTNSTIKDLTIAGRHAVEYHDFYTNEDRVSYAVSKNDIGVVVHSNTFKGDYSSYKNADNVDYRTYLPAIKALAESIRFNF